MRMRNPKDKNEVLNSCDFYLDESLFNNIVDKVNKVKIGSITKNIFIQILVFSFCLINNVPIH